MPLPKSVTRLKGKGVTFTSNVDRIQYDIYSLSSRALYDVGKFLRWVMIRKAKAYFKGVPYMRIKGAYQHWVRKYADTPGDLKPSLWIGSKAKTWYGDAQELGDTIYVGPGGVYRATMKKHGVIKNSVMENLNSIQKIEAKYLSAIEDELKARELGEMPKENDEDSYEG